MGLIEAVHGLKQTVVEGSIAVYNGVAVRDTGVFDAPDHYPDHKTVLVDTIQAHIREGDRVVVVGGGRGVAATHAARAGGRVVVYEAATEMVDILAETAALNSVEYEVRHAIVGDCYDVYGTLGDADTVAPGELSGDVLVLDCEGAETDILPVEEFRTVIAETHPKQGAETADVVELLSDASVVAPDPVDGDVVIGA